MEMSFPAYHAALYRTSSVVAGFKHIKLGGFGDEEFDWRKEAGGSSEAVSCNQGVSPDSRNSPAGHVNAYTSARTAIAAINIALQSNASSRQRRVGIMGSRSTLLRALVATSHGQTTSIVLR